MQCKGDAISTNKNVQTFNIKPEDLTDYTVDLRYKSDVTNPEYYYFSNMLPMLNFEYNKSSKDKTSYEHLYYINWNSKEKILFINAGSFPSLNSYSVYRNIDINKFNELAQIKMDFKKYGFPQTFDNYMKPVLDSNEKSDLIQKYLITNGVSK